MSFWKKVKKGAKHLAKKAKKAAKKAEKTATKAENTAIKIKNKAIREYNKREAPLRNAIAGVIPKSLRKQFVRGAKMTSSTINRIERGAKKLADKAGVKEAYNYAEHFNPLNDVKNAALLVQGKKSFGQIAFEEGTHYSDHMLRDKMKYEKWVSKKIVKAPSAFIHSGRITNASGSHERIKIPELNLRHPGDGPHNSKPQPVFPGGRSGDAQMAGTPEIEGSLPSRSNVQMAGTPQIEGGLKR